MKMPTGVTKLAAIVAVTICLLPALLCGAPGLLEQSGIAIAHSDYFICLKDGAVVCLSGE